MRNDNLTRSETADRSQLVAVESYDVLLDLSTAPDPEADSFRSVTTVRFSAEEGAQTFLDFIAHSVESVTVNGRELDPDDVVEGARIRLPSLETSNEVSVAGRGRYSRSGEGMHRFVDPADGRVYLYTQYEPADARRVFANFEQPDLKASFRFTVLAPEGWQVSSNGVRMAVSPAPEAERAGSVRHEFAPTERISTYITTVLAGPYHRVAGEWRHSFEDGSRMSVPLALYCRASLAEHLDAATGAPELFDLTRQGLTFFTELFGYPYPFGKYEQAFVPEYNLGAMENPGLVTFTEEYLFPDGATRAQYQGRANTLMHEMSHMWFGDLVTMTWWDDLWLKESFAEFMGAHASVQATDFEEAWIAFADRRKAWAYRQDQLPTTHPVVADVQDLEAARQNFDGITYAKGAAVLKQLVAFVGYEPFVDACRSYFRRHAYGSTTLEDFLAVLEEASGRDVRGWAESWLATSGVSTLTLDLARDDDGTVTFAALLQDPGPGVLRPHRLLLGGYERGPGDVLVRTGTVSVDLPAEASVEVPELVGSTAPLLVVNDEDLTYAKTRLDPLSLTTALSSLSSVEDDMARAQLWSGLWNATRDAELDPGDWVGAVLDHGFAEPRTGMFSTAVDHAVEAVERFTPTARRARLRGRLLDAAVRELRRADPGSDRQLALARLTARTARRDGSHAGWLRDLLGGRDALPGLRLGPELRWALWTALAATGHGEDPELEAALEREHAGDRTRTGQVGWARARAARPLPGAKAAAWEAITGDELSNDLLTATIEGFRLGPAELVEPYRERYFGMLEEVWAHRSIGMATRIVAGLYPGGADLEPGHDPGHHPVLARTELWLNSHAGAPAALRRILVEERDHLLRALRAQAAARP
ncbi:aminopeptidase N [Kocuria rosea subsp. polaris]|uniref:Aminopeptidase N n=1 Tax=Kocuria rosea subsp. polaris TaxID=136273 RepID=A0A0W8I4N0_KOCRO|nr:aminopeptidase N [Kocuria polaris]KUG52976.1 aminopeptidase N [Kocuria polaris]